MHGWIWLGVSEPERPHNLHSEVCYSHTLCLISLCWHSSPSIKTAGHDDQVTSPCLVYLLLFRQGSWCCHDLISRGLQQIYSIFQITQKVFRDSPTMPCWLGGMSAPHSSTTTELCGPCRHMVLSRFQRKLEYSFGRPNWWLLVNCFNLFTLIAQHMRGGRNRVLRTTIANEEVLQHQAAHTCCSHAEDTLHVMTADDFDMKQAWIVPVKAQLARSQIVGILYCLTHGCKLFLPLSDFI